MSLAKVAAAVKVVITARYFGASDELDAYLIAFLLPSFFVDAIATTFTPSLIPGLIRARTQQGDGAAAKLAQAGQAMVLATIVPVGVLLAIAGRWALPLLGSSFSEEKLNLTTVLLWSMLVWLPMSACSAVWRALLNAHDRLALAAAVQVGTSAFTILLLAAGGTRWGVWVLTAAVVMGATFEFVVLGVAAARLGYPLRPRWMGWTPDVRAVREQYGPLLAGTLLVSACALVDQAVAGSLGSGSVAALSYGTKFSSVLVAVGGIGLATAVLPQFSRLAAEQRWQSLRRAFGTHVMVAAVVMIPVTGALIWWSAEAVRITYEGGQFGAGDTELVSSIQRLALLQAPFVVVLMVAQRLATALGKTQLVLKAGIAAVVTNVTGDLLLPRWMGVGGIALASSLGHCACLVVLLLLLERVTPRHECAGTAGEPETYSRAKSAT